MSRTCGGCTMCCVIPEQRELNKPANVVCEHCAVGTGCTIYKQRPQGCRDFQCLWLASPVIPDELRPDRIGVVFEALVNSRTCLALVDPRNQHAWKNPGAMRIIQNLLGHGVAVVIVCNGARQSVLLPKGRTTKQVMDDVMAEAVS